MPGDRVTCDGEDGEGEPDAQLNPKKKIFETVAVHLKTNDDRIATSKGAKLGVAGKGPCFAPTLAGALIH